MGLFFKDKEPPKAAPKTKPILEESKDSSLMNFETKFKLEQSVAPDSSLTGFFEKVMEEYNQSGPDYLEFCKILQLNSSLPVEEQQKFITSFNSFKAQGISMSQLINSARFYLENIEEKKKAEDEDIAKSKKNLVEIPLAEVKTLAKENETLARKIGENNAKIAEIQANATTNSFKISYRGAALEQEFTKACESINSRIKKIQTYLNDTNE